MFNVRFPAALIGLGLTLPWVTPEPARYALFAQAPRSLLVSNWSPSPTTTPGLDHEAYLGGELATLNGTTYMVRSDRCGAWSCSGGFQYLYWSKLTPAGWTPGTWIPNQSSARRVSLAAFNGFLYMVRTDASDEGAVWLSKFNPDTEDWELKSMLSYRTFAGPPAIAAFDNKLHFVGTTGEDPDEIMAPYQMWTATMTAGEAFTPARPMLGHTSASRPSIAVYDNKLYVAHRAGETGEIQYGYRQAGSNVSWTPPKYIRSGPLTAPAGPRFRSLEPAFASVEGYLHLLFRTPESNYVWWSYFDTCTWATPVSLGTQQTTTGPSLTQGGNGLLLATTADVTWNSIVETRRIGVLQFTAPSAPITLPKGCGVVAQ